MTLFAGARTGLAATLFLLVACAPPAEPAGTALIRFAGLESDLREADGLVVLAIERAGSEVGEVSVRFATLEGSARAGEDFLPVSGDLTWADGDASLKRIEIPLVDDAIHEEGEVFTVELAEPTGMSRLDPTSAVAVEKRQTLGSPDAVLPAERMSVVLRITDDDAPVKIPEDQPNVVEIVDARVDTSGEPVLAVSVERSGGTPGEVTVDYETIEETAVAGVDFTPAAGTLRWADGDPSAIVVDVPLLGAGGGRTLQFRLANPVNAGLGASSSISVSLPDLRAQPVARVSADPLTGPAPLDVRFDAAESSDPDGSIVRYQWDFGDGTSAEGSAATHRFADVGSVEVRLSVTDDDGLTSVASVQISVTAGPNEAPVADPGQPISVTDTDGDGIQTVTLDGSASYDPDGSIVAYAWYDGDSMLATGPGPDVDLGVGVHSLTLEVTDDGGATASAGLEVTVEPSTPPQAQVPLRINAGGSMTTDLAGNTWAADQAYGPGIPWGFENPPSGSFGSVDRLANDPTFDVGGTEDDAIFATERWGLQAYRVNLPDGDYRVSLMFAEGYASITGPGQRVFDVSMEGVEVAADVDIYAAVGFAQAYTIVVDGVTVQDGRLDIEFTANVQNPMICGVEIVPSVSQPAVVERRIQTSLDDVEENGNGAIDPTSTDLELGIYNGAPQLVGMRFTNISIPQGSVITSAYVQYQVDEVSTNDAVLLFQAELADDAPALSTTAQDLSSRPRGTAPPIGWVAPPWPTVGDAGPDQRTPNLAPLLQELVDRPGWTAGNAVVLLVSGTGTRTAESFDGVASAAPLLHVEYVAP